MHPFPFGFELREQVVCFDEDSPRIVVANRAAYLAQCGTSAVNEDHDFTAVEEYVSVRREVHVTRVEAKPVRGTVYRSHRLIINPTDRFCKPAS